MPALLLKNGRVIDPATKRDEVLDVLIEGQLIKNIGPLSADSETKVIDLTGKIVTPGLIDLHVHLRDLEQSYKETIATGTAAALRGGVTTVMAMPNTSPPLDCADAIRTYLERINKEAAIKVLVAGAITKDLGSGSLAEIDTYPSLGIKAISNDGLDVADDPLFLQAFLKCKALGLLMFCHAEMMSMAKGAPIHEGVVSQKLGVLGAPRAKEVEAIKRIITMAEKVGTRVHITHVSLQESVELIRQAKKRSKLITCDATPHHLALTDEAVIEHGSQAKVNPPLRTEADRLALIEGVKDDTIDAIVTDHAPHAAREKTADLMNSAFGFSGLETLVPVILNTLYHQENMALLKIFAKMSLVPAQIIGDQSIGRLQIGQKANITVIDLDQERKVQPEKFVSLGHNTPFRDRLLKSWPVLTIYQGKIHE